MESLAFGLLKEVEQDPASLSQMEIFLPSRRACLELQHAFVRQRKGQCLLLPKLSPLGDLGEDEELLSSPQDHLILKPLIPPYQRLGLLTKLIEDYLLKVDLPSSPVLSFKLAKNLIRLMDQAAIENVPWEGLKHLVPSEFAGHWQLTLDFLEIITTHWPQILEEKGVVEPYVRHHQLVDLLIARMQHTPPSHPILAAGSTATMPATARLLQEIATLPQGAVILPGLDTTLSAEEAMTLSPCHPQYAHTQFLQKLKLTPQDIPTWLGIDGAVPHPRAALLAAALKPSFSLVEKPSAKTLDDVHLIPCASPQEEALVIAILLRQQLEIPNKRAALITADLKLGERVRGELKRWGIEIDSSSGEPLDQTPPGVFVKLCAEYAATPEDPVAFLSLLKHPLFRAGRPVKTLRKDIRTLEKKELRGEGSSLKESTLFCFLRPLVMTDEDGKTLFRSHQEMAESLATDDQGKCLLWEGETGKALKIFFETLQDVVSDFPPLSLADYPAVLKELFQGQSFRSPLQKHPRLSILGPIEARLFHADVMILGGLNEGTWPPTIDMDPWLNRPMRQELGFPSPERRIGLSAHDFSQAFASSKVYLTRALKVDGTPTLACRWLERLETYLKGWDLSLPLEPRVVEWARELDRPKKQHVAEPLLPRPPVKVRPRRLSVTQIETWMRDPYALYARSILSLSPLDPLDVSVNAAQLGTLTHAILDQFFKVFPDPFRRDALEGLLLIGKTLSEPYEDTPSVRLFWQPRFFQLAKWFIETERRTRLVGTKTFTEIKGKMTLETPYGPFECTAKADRIDVLPDGRLRIIDYKTGALPSDQEVILGFSPQLPLEGAIALQQGFEGIPAIGLESLQFWGVKGDMKGGRVKTIPGDPNELAVKALLGLQRMIVVFENEATPYPARPVPTKALRYNDYAQLARLSSLS